MKRTIGIVMIVIGAVMLIWTGFTYTKREKIIDAGPIQVSAEKEKQINWPPYAGGVLVIAGALLIATGQNKS